VDLDNIDVLILCGGKGTRLQTTVPDKPKILADINGSPFIFHLLEYLDKVGIRRVILCTGYLNDQIENWISESYTGEIEVNISLESKPLGTAGAVKNAQPLIRTDRFIVLNGDTYSKIDYQRFITSFEAQSEAVGVIVVKKVNNIERYGRIQTDEEGRIISFDEKQLDGPGYVSAGIYLFAQHILELIPEEHFSSFEQDIFPLIIEKGHQFIYAHSINDHFIDIGTPESYHRANKDLNK